MRKRRTLWLVLLGVLALCLMAGGSILALQARRESPEPNQRMADTGRQPAAREHTTVNKTPMADHGEHARPRGQRAPADDAKGQARKWKQPERFGDSNMPERRRERRGHGGMPLLRLFMGLPALEKAGRALTPAQAREILAVMTPLRTQATLTPEEAIAAHTKLANVLTPEQLTAIDNAPRPERGRIRGNGGDTAPGMEGRPRGERPPRPQGAPGEENRPRGERPEEGFQPGERAREMPAFNPFNPKAENPFAARMAERMNEIFAALEANAGK